MIKFDLRRSYTRITKRKINISPAYNKLHFGCGSRRVSGWLNVDLVGSELNVDLASGRLPWKDGSFSAIASHHVVEHLELVEELIPLMKELHRVSRPMAEIWLSCPDMEKVCRSYLEDKGASLLADRLVRFPDGYVGRYFKNRNIPRQHFINLLFNQNGEHRNLFDFELLSWALKQALFVDCTRVTEQTFLERFPEFPPRRDDMQSIYIRAFAGP
jgi:predicted SAM-dependent methyltransferase